MSTPSDMDPGLPPRVSGLRTIGVAVTWAIAMAAFSLSLPAETGAPNPPSTAVGGVSLGLYRDGLLVDTLHGVDLADLTAPPRARKSLQSTGQVRMSTSPAPLLSASTSERNTQLSQAADAGFQLRQYVDGVIRLLGANRLAHDPELVRLAGEFRQMQGAARSTLVELQAEIERRGLPSGVLARNARTLERHDQRMADFDAALGEAIAGVANGATRLQTLLNEAQFVAAPRVPSEPTVRTSKQETPRLSRPDADALFVGATQGSAASRRPAALQSLASRTSPAKREALRPRLSSTPPGPSDLAPTPDVQITQEISAKAAELGNSALAIYEFVRNNVGFEAYLGSRKGSAYTLQQLRGNDTDQASLLIALLRSAGIPARYARGTIEMTPAQAMSLTGTEDPQTAASILTTAGLDGLAIVDGPDVVAVRCTRVWVEAYVPYSNYRGGPGDDTGKTWISLDPGFKAWDVQPGQDVLQSMGWDVDVFLANYLSTFHALSPIEQLQADIQTWLDANQPGTQLEGVARHWNIALQNLGLLPASLPYQVVNVSSEFSELENSKRYQVRFHLYSGATTFIDHTIRLVDLLGHRLTIEYVGATPGDQAVIDSYGNIYETPPNLVDVKPLLKLDNDPIATSTSGIGMGLTHNSDMEFLEPAGASNQQPFVQNDIIAGNGQAIAFDSFLDRPDLGFNPSVAPADQLIESVMHPTAADYLRRVSAGLGTAGGLLHVVTVQDISEAIVENSIKVTYSGFGTPLTFEWTGLIVDADRRVIGPFPVDGTDTRKVPYMKLTGYDGSSMEHRIWEDIFGQDAVSTIKILQLANDAGVGVCVISNSIAGQCPGFNQPFAVVNAVNGALAQGHLVTIPKAPITVQQWSGTGYIDLDPGTGAGGYIISGGINGNVSFSGGATVESWPVVLPCANPAISNDAGDPIRAYYNGSATATDEFCGCDTRHIRLKGKFVVKCGSDPEQRQPFDQVTSLSVKDIADKFGGGNYQLTLLTTILLQFKIVTLELRKFEFTSDHGVLTDYNTDYGGSGGTVFNPRGWQKGGPNNPITHTHDASVAANATVLIKPAGVTITLIGDAPIDGLDFEKAGVGSTGADQVVAVTSKGKLPKEVGIQQHSIDWSLKMADGTQAKCLSSGAHKIYVLWGSPGTGPTLKRINRVATECNGLNSEPAIVERLWEKVAGPGVYVLGSPYPTPEWKILDGTPGECIALANLFRKTIEMMGVTPGNGTVMYLYADINGGSHESTSPNSFIDPQNKRGCANGQNGHTAVIGATHDDVRNWEELGLIDGSGGVNNWEACYKYRHTAADPFKWYAAGTGGHAAFTSVQAVLDAITSKTRWYYYGSVSPDTFGPCTSPGPDPERVW